MIAVTIGTTSFRQTDTLGPSEVEFTGAFIYFPDGITPAMVWDNGLQNVRAMTPAERISVPLAASHADMVVQLSNGLQSSKLLRAVMLMILDEFNAHALKINAILDAIDGATTLAQVKSAVALISDYPQRTKAQLITAVTNKINAGDADS